MNRFSWKLVALATLAITGLWTATSNAEWPRIRVNNSYSLPSAPAYRPVFQPAPVLLPAAPAPGYIAPNYGAPITPNISVPGQGTSYYAPQPYAQPGSMQPGYGAPAYQQNYAPAPTTSYYAPQQPVFQPYQRPLPIHNYAQPMQPQGGYYQPNRPATFYSPSPGYHYPQPVFGGY